MAGLLGKLLPGKGSISDVDVNKLLEAPGIPIPTEEGLRDKLFSFIKKTWNDRTDKSKSVDQLVEELKSACSIYNLKTLLGGEFGSILRTLKNLREEKEEAVEELKNPESLRDWEISGHKTTIEDYDNKVYQNILGIGSMFRDGPFIKENFIFEDGFPVKIRPGEEGRWGPACAEELKQKSIKKKASKATIPEYYLDPALLGKAPPSPATAPPHLTPEQIARQAQRKSWGTRAGKRRKGKKVHRKTLRRIRHKIH